MRRVDGMRIDERAVESALVSGRTVTVVYTNYRQETLTRLVEPLRMWFGCTDWHPEPQWLVDVFDVDRGVARTFAMRDIEDFDAS